MNVVRSVAGWLVPLAILAVAVTIFVKMGSQPPPPRKEQSAAAAVSVRTVAVDEVSGGLTIESDGVVVPLREVTLAAEVAGRVIRKAAACNEGQHVAKGTVLFEIDPRDYHLDVERLERESTQAGLAIEEIDEEAAQNAELVALARRQVELARREVARLENLKADRIVTESEHDRAIREELTASNTVATLEGQRRVLAKRRTKLVEAVSLCATMLDKAKLDLSRTSITAPIDGLIVEDKVEEGSFVAKGTPLVSIEDTSVAEVRTNLEMEDIATIWGGRKTAASGGHEAFDMPAAVVFRIGEAVYEWEGMLSRQAGRGLDEKTRTLPCRVVVADPAGVKAIDRYGGPMPTLPPNAPRSLLRGMFVRVQVHVDSPVPLVSIPEEAQRPNGEVWIMREGRLEIIRPRPVQAVGGRLVFESMTSGLQPSDRVIVSQIAAPREGTAVVEADSRPAKPSAQSAARDAENPT
jgi:multidrug efflux pump subunit AcrA (membrane-fusion protein)